MRLHLHNGFGAGLPSWRLLAGTAAIALTASLALALSQPAILDAGAATSFDPRTSELTVRRGTAVLTMKIGERHATLDGRPIELKNAPFTVHGRAMVRGSDVAMALGSAVKYDVARGRIDVRTPGAVVAGVPDDGQ